MINILKYFYSKNSIKRKVLEIQDGIKNLISPVCTERFWVTFYGVYYMDPKQLVFWICVESDETKEKLKSNYEINKNLRNLLEKYEYPIEARNFVSIGFESQETVDRESDGKWWDHFR